MDPAPRSKLAVIGGFMRPRDNLAHGSHHAAYSACEAIARLGVHSEIHVYHEHPQPPGRPGELILPKTPPCRLFDKTSMPATGERYQAVYLANGEQVGPVPWVLRPHADWAPVICTVGTTHAGPQWMSLLLALASNGVRPSDGFIFKSRAAQTLFREVWQGWSQRLGLQPGFPEQSEVIPNGIDVEAHRHSPRLREETRRKLRLRADDVVFLAFSRLSPGTKGDQLALIVRWREVIEKLPSAVLLLAGVQVDRAFTMEQRHLARAAGVSDRVVVLENPFELLPDARTSLMSAADLFVHLTTGVEEAAPLVVHEAMAHGLPVVATRWAGLPELVSDGENGLLVGTAAAPVPAAYNQAIFGVTDLAVGLQAGRSVVCDFDDLVQRVAVLGDSQRRRALGEAARRSAEGRSSAIIARALVDFFQRTSRRAQQSWPVAHAFRPLVEMDQVLAAQTSRVLQPGDRVRRARADRADLLTEGLDPEDPGAVRAALDAFGPGSEIDLGTLAAAITGRTDPGALRAASRLIVRLLNLGALSLVR